MKRRALVSAVAAVVALLWVPVQAQATNSLPYSWLPWQGGISQTVTQGNNQGTHTGLEQYAWDFGGSWNVLASRGGVVSMVKSDSSTGACNPQYANYANYVVVNTGDTYQTLYLHLAYQSVPVVSNQRVGAYTQLGTSDSTGYVCGAHLHYQ
jgi:murein DD-endopeptidase MepM/ murein hydrolase activator NlpD